MPNGGFGHRCASYAYCEVAVAQRTHPSSCFHVPLEIDKPLTAHMDFLPIRNGAADILDYKSNDAKHEKPIPQLLRSHAPSPAEMGFTFTTSYVVPGSIKITTSRSTHPAARQVTCGPTIWE